MASGPRPSHRRHPHDASAAGEAGSAHARCRTGEISPPSFRVLVRVADARDAHPLHHGLGGHAARRLDRDRAEVHAAVADPAIDGVVIVHGTDTMAYTASALALMLGAPSEARRAHGRAASARRGPNRRPREPHRRRASSRHCRVPEVTDRLRLARSSAACAPTKRDAWAFDAFDSPELRSARRARHRASRSARMFAQRRPSRLRPAPRAAGARRSRLPGDRPVAPSSARSALA